MISKNFKMSIELQNVCISDYVEQHFRDMDTTELPTELDEDILLHYQQEIVEIILEDEGLGFIFAMEDNAPDLYREVLAEIKAYIRKRVEREIVPAEELQELFNIFKSLLYKHSSPSAEVDAKMFCKTWNDYFTLKRNPSLTTLSQLISNFQKVIK